MPVSVVVGGQYGSEGKGKVAKYLAETMDARIAIRCGGTNSGHTVIDDAGQPVIFRQLPTPCLLESVTCVLVAGSYIDLDILFQEITTARLEPTRLRIDPNAVIITDAITRCEQEGSLCSAIGSTGSGTGEAVLQRIRRDSALLLAKDVPDLQPYIEDTKKLLRESLNRNERIILEGTQGYGLSLLHSEHYPFVTSRDTTAAGFLSEAGLSPFDVDDIALVIRAHPIRVSGNSGPLPNEIDWNILSNESLQESLEPEQTSVTKSKRRVARFDAEIVIKAMQSNTPSRIVLNHLDYIPPHKQISFLAYIESAIGKFISLIGTGRDDISER